jgi:sulfur-oxidizing protein SoxY
MTISRRDMILGAGGTLALPRQSLASSPFEEALRSIPGGASPKHGRVSLDIPPITENGNSVPITISIESPMTVSDHVKTIGLFAEKNPHPEIARFHLGPRAGRAQVSATIRLATSQRVLALAVMNDGSVWSGEKDVVVTLSACIDGG